jgi:ribosomal protein S18 acetylase RimI-like enzyme
MPETSQCKIIKLFKKKNHAAGFLCSELEIKHDKEIPPEEVQKIYASVGWQYREKTKIQQSLLQSFIVTSIWLKNELIAFARATGDGIFNVMIWDVAVKPKYQGQGIGKLLLKSMLTKLDDYDISLITLYSELDNKNFYCKLGFECDTKKIITMFRYKTRRCT